MNDLTDRYIDTALRSVLPRKRSDIEPELRALIADAVDARVAGGQDRAAAEVAALTELGDPARLAAGYADEPLHLIGPGLFLDYVRTLRLLAVTGVPATALAVTLAQVLQGASVAQVVGRVAATVFTVAVQLGFWTTVGFAILERVPGVRTPLAGPWTPSMLPPSRTAARGTDRPGLGWELSVRVAGFGVLATWLLLVPRTGSWHDDAGNPVNALHPWLWETGVVFAFVATMGLGVVLAVAARYRPRLATIAAAAGLLPTAILLWVAATRRLINPEFPDAVGWTPSVTEWMQTAVTIAAAVGLVSNMWEVIQTIRKR